MKNPLKSTPSRMDLSGLVRWVLLAVTVGTIGISFVMVRNRHVSDGDIILAYEEEIRHLDREIEMLELRIDAQMNREEIAGSLFRQGSTLQPVNPMRVLTIRPADLPADGAVASRR